MAELTTEYLDKQLKAQTEELKDFSKGQTEELATMVKTSFDHVDHRFDEVQRSLDVSDKIQVFDKKFTKLEGALNIKL